MFTTRIERKKQLLQPTAEEIFKSNERYQRLYELTLEISGTNHLPAVYWRDESKWRALAHTWKILCLELQCEDVFYAVINHIHWGVYPDQDKVENWNLHQDDEKSNAMQEFLVLVEKELLAPGQAAYEWSNWEPFKTAVWPVIRSRVAPKENGPCSLSDAHHEFLRAKTCYKLYTLDENRRGWLYFQYIEEAVHLLLPESINWLPSQWADERYIFDRIRSRYQVDYTTAVDDFSFLMRAYWVRKLNFEFPSVAKSNELIRAIEILPYSMVSALWPEDTKSMVTAWYLDAARIASRYKKRKATYEKSVEKAVPDSRYDYRYLKVSWLQKIMKDWVSDGTITDKKIKKKVFDVEVS